VTTSYDRIAEIYDVDMARNMAFDDVGFYVERCPAHARVLELGCGNGRILLELAARRHPVVGVDASQQMLRVLLRKARWRGIASPPVCRMDVRALGFGRAFDVVLCPYSLATYLLTDSDFARMAAGVRECLTSTGSFIVDAFVPKPVASMSEFTLDYRRPTPDGELVRWKRITALDAERNRIERRYERYDRTGALLDTIDMIEELRPLSPDKLRSLVQANGFAIEQEWWDYGATEDGSAAQFFTLVARPVR